MEAFTQTVNKTTACEVRLALCCKFNAPNYYLNYHYLKDFSDALTKSITGKRFLPHMPFVLPDACWIYDALSVMISQ